ncbi:type II secretion system minor pseudopilin GspH [Hyphococcus sp.]|uniref:type II secretion system minor pseudopilin GspH n=1 Tax=Hyphococcus sp. TaxID=2038636 RepID=UPI003CCBC0B4
MLILATGRKNSSDFQQRRRQQGVTLVELLVVLAIIAMIASVVVLNAPPARSDIDRASEVLAARTAFAADEAITAGITVGLSVTESGFRFLQYDDGEWSETSKPQLRPYTFSANYAVSFDAQETAAQNERSESPRDEERRPEPEIRFTPTGETTPFTMTFRSRRGTAAVSLNDAGEVKLSAGGDEQ